MGIAIVAHSRPRRPERRGARSGTSAVYLPLEEDLNCSSMRLKFQDPGVWLGG